MSAQSRRRAAALAERDIEILRLVLRFRLMTANQIQRVVFTTGSPATRARRTRSVLRRLSDHHYLIRLERRIGGIHAGSQGTVYRISGRGIGVMARIDGTARRRVGGEPGQRFVAHVLAVTELAVTLQERAATDDPIRVESFLPEPLCWRRYPAPHGGTATLRPDAYVHTADREYEHLHFVEMDMATESLPTIGRHCQAYIAYWRSGSEQQRTGTFPRVLWVVPHERRRAQIEQVLRRLPRDHQPLFAAATAEDAVALLAGHDPAIDHTPNQPSGGITP